VADLPPPPDYAPEPVWDGDLPHPDVTVKACGYDGAAEFATWCRGLLAGMRDAGTLSRDHERFERAYLANLGLYKFYGATFYLARDDLDWPVSLIVARPGTSPRRNAWGRYVNHYLAYTAPNWRRQGYATAAETKVRQLWAGYGYDRVKTLCQSWLGFCYHEHLRDRIWGVKAGTGELAIDSPLKPHRDGTGPAGIPIKARAAALHPDTGQEMTCAELEQHLTDPGGRFRRTPEEVDAVLLKRTYRRA
jgi:GNAT superfamily N-acetyltransferase